MGDRPLLEEALVVLRATVSGDGSPGPIEERIGRKLVRLVDPGSAEGSQLLRAGRVELVGPGGERLGRIDVEEARRRLTQRLVERLESSEVLEDDLLRDALYRLRASALRGN